MMDAIPNGLSNLELLYMCKRSCDGSRMTDGSIDSFLLAELLDRGLVTQGMIVSGIDSASLFQDELKREVDKAVSKECFVEENNVIKLYADYNDTIDFLLETVYAERDSEELESSIYEKIYEDFSGMDVSIQEIENNILHEMGVFDTELEDAARECFQEHYTIEPPYEHFLEQDMKVNIMLATDEERDQDCGSIFEQYIALTAPGEVGNVEGILAEKTGLTFLLEQQGYTLEQLTEVMEEYNEFFYDKDGYLRKDLPENSYSVFEQTHSKFLTSVCQELENQRYSMGVMTVLAKMSLKDFIGLQSGDKEVSFGKDAMLGIFNPWNGSGSVLEIELEKDLVFPSSLIRDIQIEGVKPEFEHTVNDVYGLIGSCWKEAKISDLPQLEKEEVAIDPNRKPTLSDRIAEAEAERSGGMQKDSPNKEMAH